MGIRCDILVKKHFSNPNGRQPVRPVSEREWVALYQAHEAQGRLTIEIAKAAIAISEYGADKVAVLPLSEALAEARAGAKVLYVSQSFAILSDERGEIRKAAQARKQAQTKQSSRYDGGLFH